MIDFEAKEVLFIDLDGTLIKTISGKTFPEDITDFRIQLPVLNKIVEKLPNLEYFYIVTNQGGIEKGYVDEDEFINKINAILTFCSEYLRTKLNRINIFDSYEYCPKNKLDFYRKPNVGMLELLKYRCSRCSKDSMLMIGDASGKPGDFSDSDKKCAENFGIDYIDVIDFLEL